MHFYRLSNLIFRGSGSGLRVPGSEVRGHLKVLAVSDGELGVELDEFRRERLARRAPARAAISNLINFDSV